MPLRKKLELNSNFTPILKYFSRIKVSYKIKYMIFYPILAQISISYLYLLHFSKHCCVSQLQWGSWSLAAFLCNKYCSLYSADKWTRLLINFWEKFYLVSWSKISDCSVTLSIWLILPYAQSTASTLIILCIEFVRYFDDIVTPRKIWI